MGRVRERGGFGLGEVGVCKFRKEHGAFDVCIERFEVGSLGHVVDGLVVQPGGVQDYNIKAAECGDCLGQEVFAFVDVGNVGLDCNCADWVGGVGGVGVGRNEVDDLLGLDGVGVVVDDDVEAILSEAEGDGAADPAGGSGDDCDATIGSHFWLLLVLEVEVVLITIVKFELLLKRIVVQVDCCDEKKHEKTGDWVSLLYVFSAPTQSTASISNIAKISSMYSVNELEKTERKTQ